MRPLKINGKEVDGGNNLIGRNSLVPAFQELWNVWEIHCLVLLSLCLQVFLFLFAGLRRRSASPLLHIVLWLAYLLADSVAIFVLGHLAVHASQPGHQLMSFWAPFMLVHLGGQDTITALSRQDNELWKRHLLSFVSLVAVAGYVVAKASWPDARLMAAMVLMFLSGCFKYAERTLCFYLASPEKLRSHAMGGLPDTLEKLQETKDKLYPFGLGSRNRSRAKKMKKALDNISTGRSSSKPLVDAASTRDILIADAPLNTARIVSFAEDHIPAMLERFQSSSERCDVYKQVGAVLVHFYLDLYTKNPLRKPFIISSYSFIRKCVCNQEPCQAVVCCALCCIYNGPFLLYDIFQYVSTPIALVLFWAAEKGSQDQLYSSRAVIAVSYTLLVGAIVLDVSFAAISTFSKYIQLPAPWSKKQWSEELAQYSMIKRHIVQDTSGMASICQWIGRRLGAWGFYLLEVTHTPITEDRTPIKEFILDNLLAFGIRKKWNIASSRGGLALKEWMDKHDGLDCERIRKALVKTIGTDVDFPTSMLIWHIATDICYYFENNGSTDSDNKMKKHKQMSRELSNYIMYLVFKSGLMLTTYSQYVHEKAHDEITTLLTDQQGQRISLGEKEAVMKLFDAKKEEEQQEQTTVDIQNRKHDEEPAANDNNTGDSHMRKLVQSAEATTLPVVPRACLVAKELINTNDEAERWGLIAEVWSEMLYYIAPRCGCAFHYEHLSTGGEFITHVLVLMKVLGPFLPAPGA